MKMPLFLTFFLFFGILCQADQDMNGMTGENALKILMEGNERFREDRSLHPDRTSERRLETVSKQTPFAVVLGCSDSRSPTEIIFDQGIGDLFIVRVAGNIMSPVVLDSIEYSVIYLGSKLILVMGHENCGAVSAVLNGTTKDIESVAEKITPAVERAKKIKKGNPLENAIKENVRLVTEELLKSRVLGDLVKKKEILIAGCYYNFHTGKVEILK